MIIQATLSDMRCLTEWAKNEGWNPGLHDAIPFYFTDPNGFFIELVDNEPIGCISAVAYNDSYGFAGFYIVKPEFRRKGYGIKLWDKAMAYLGERTVGLDGVVSEQANYQKSGFKLYYNNIRFKGRLLGADSLNVKPLDTIAFQTLVDYDTKVFGLNRATFLQHWTTQPDSVSQAFLHNGELAGYGTIRKCASGCKIGPLFADNSDMANEIFLKLIKAFEGEDIFLDVTEPNTKALELVKTHRMEKVFETARMYKKIPPKQNLEKVFGVTTFELG